MDGWIENSLKSFTLHTRVTFDMNCYLERRVALTSYFQEKDGIRNCVVFVILAVDCFLSYTDVTPRLL